MGTFELASDNSLETTQTTSASGRGREDECIIALRVYDSCRSQTCLDNTLIGSARADETTSTPCGNFVKGEIIVPTCDAADVTISRLRLDKIIVTKKEESEFNNGFWDVELQYVFKYNLSFNKFDGDRIAGIKASSVYNKKVTLFGSIGSDVVIGTDLIGGITTISDGDPIVVTSGKVMKLDAQIACVPVCGEDETERQVYVTIGLFTIVKLCRFVDLTVESRGFCVSEECDNDDPITPCAFFNSLDFPFEVFAPPQREELLGASTSERNSTRTGGCC